MSVDMRFTVYVDSGEMGRAVLAALRDMCAAYDVAPQVEVVDVGSRPQLAEQHNVVGIPTVVREEPHPRRRVIGALDDTRRVAEALGLDFQPDGDGGSA